MSDNLDLVRSIYTDWERGDFSHVDWAHPDIEYVMVDEPGSQSVRGVSAMAASWRTFLSAWEDYRVEVQGVRVLDDERVLVLLNALGRGKASGLDLVEATGASKGANVLHIRSGKVMRLAAYVNVDRALADLGLDQ